MNPQEIFKLIERDLQQVERELYRHAESDVPLISHISCHIHDSGGKRVRPALLLLSAKFCNYHGPTAIELAAVVELIHSATLVHDDVIDNAQVRRGQPSVNAAWGNQVTVLMGDWLYVTSMKLTLKSRSLRILDVLTDATQKMIEGELMELSMSGRLDVTEEEHLEMSRRKTAYLFSACSRIGAILGGLEPELEDKLAAFGMNLGIAFQLIDDVLDLTSTEKALGKPVVSDLKEGKLTLPLIYLLEHKREQYSEMIKTVLREGGFISVRQDEIMRAVRENGTLERARAKAQFFAEQAKGYLSEFKDSPFKRALLSIPDFIVRRDR